MDTTRGCPNVYPSQLITLFRAQTNTGKKYVEIKCQLDATDDFYCRSYCLLNMFREPLCPSSGAREYYTSGCWLSYLVLGFQVFGMVWSWGLCVRFAGCCGSPQTGHTSYRKLETQAPNTTGSNHLYNTLELLMMGIMVPETRWASNKIRLYNFFPTLSHKRLDFRKKLLKIIFFLLRYNLCMKHFSFY